MHKNRKGKIIICSRGHRFSKSTRYPVCPKCWPGYYKKKDTKRLVEDEAVAAVLRAEQEARDGKILHGDLDELVERISQEEGRKKKKI